jgi:hypothetical protein
MTMARAHLVDASVTRWSCTQGALRDPGQGLGKRPNPFSLIGI